nr:disease resistance protein RGA2-like isoform X1 [Setaria viridis]
MELDPLEEFKRLDPSRGKGKLKITVMARNMMETLLGVTKKRTLMTHVPVSSSTLCPAEEEFPPLRYLKIKHCKNLKLCPRIPNSKELFINNSDLSMTNDTWSSTPILTQAIQKLKISNCKSYDLQKLPGIQSVRELEIDCSKVFDRFDELRCMDHLAKLTLSSLNFLDRDKAAILEAIPHIQCIKINEGMYFAVQESDFLLLRQNTDFGITDLFISNLEKVNSADEVGLGELATYDKLRTLRLVWSHDANSYSSNGLSGSGDRPNNVYLNLSIKFSRADDSSVLQRLHPHPNLLTLQIEGYRDATFCGWMSDPNLYLPNLVKIVLMGMPRCARLPSLGQLANLEELHISDMPNIREVDASFYGGRDPFRKLRKFCIDKMENLEVLSTNLELSAGEMSWDDDEQKVQGDEIFPRLAHLVITGCPRLTLSSAFQGYIGRIVASCSKVELSPGILVGSPHLFRLEVKPNIFGFSDASEFLQYNTDLWYLTIQSDSDLITLPEIIRSCHSLRSLRILDGCCNFAALPDWLGDLASLEHLEVYSAKLQHLPHSIKDVTSLKTLTLKKCNYKLRECCSRLGEDYDKINHIDEGPSFAVSSSDDMAILQKTTSHQLIELNIKHLEGLSSSEANIIELAQKEELQFLSLEWSGPVFNKVALEELRPHQNLKRLCIKNYVGGDFPNWLRLLPNLVRLSFSMFNLVTSI